LPLFWSRAIAIFATMLFMYPVAVVERHVNSLVAWIAASGVAVAVAFALHHLLGWS
jgi:hypothetical protein